MRNLNKMSSGFIKKSMTRTSISFLSFLIIFSLILPTGCAKKEKEIKIGVILPLTGEMASHGEDAKKGITLAIELKNQEGGINGKKIVAIFEDDKMNPQNGVSAFRKLTTIDKVQVVIGGLGSSVALAIAPIAQKQNVVFISPTASHPRLPLVGDYIFRIWASDIFEGKQMAKYAYNKLKLRKVSILFVNNDFGRGISKIFSQEFKSLGGQILTKDSYEQGDTDFRAQLYRIKKANPDAIYLPGYYQEVARILKQIKELGIKSQPLSTTPVENPKLIELAGNAADGLIYTRPAFDPKRPTKKYREFMSLFKKRYGVDPGIAAAYAFDATNVILECIQKVGYSAPRIKKALLKIKDYEGATGKISFDSHGDVIRDFDLFIVKNGKFIKYDE